MSQVGNCTEIDPGAGGWGGKESWLLMGTGLLSGDEQIEESWLYNTVNVIDAWDPTQSQVFDANKNKTSCSLLQIKSESSWQEDPVWTQLKLAAPTGNYEKSLRNTTVLEIQMHF